MPIVRMTWTPAVRVVPRFPPIEQLEQFDADLQAAVLAELSAVDPQIIGNLQLLPPGALPTGTGASRIITSYTFSRPGRFNDETFAALRTWFSPAGIVDLALTVGWYYLCAAILGPLRIDVEDL